MPLFKCRRCSTVAEHPTPRCVPCDLDPATDPQVAGVIAPVVTIHLDPPHPKAEGRGLGHAACDPGLKVGTGQMFTGEKTAVTCPACKASEAFAAAGPAGVAPLPLVPLEAGPRA